MSAYAGPIIDSHIHLFDPRRPQGIPWPEAGHPLCRPTLPEHYRDVAAPHPVAGAIVVEASPWRDDNFWLRDTLRAAQEMHRDTSPHVLGFVGNLAIGVGDYAADIAQLCADPLFLGLRHGNLWDRDLLTDIAQPAFLHGLKQLAAQGRCLDSANPDPRLIEGLLRLSDAIPTLTIVIDHLPNVALDTHDTRAYERDLHALAQRPRIFVKLSEVPQRHGDRVCLDPARYRDSFDTLWTLFGADRTLFGSDWPNSESLTSFTDNLVLMQGLMADKSVSDNRRFFCDNALRAYGLDTPSLRARLEL